MKFIDLFGGIGGFSLGLERCGHAPVGYYEIDKRATSVYNRNFGTDYAPADITRVDAEDVPDHDILCAGFPCQAFSLAGKRKGFADPRGTLFYEIARIAEHKRPRYLFLENVRGLLSHDGGATFLAILQRLDDLGYFVEWQMHDSKNHGVPQQRERVFIIGHLGGEPERKVFPLGACLGLHSEKDGQANTVRGQGGWKGYICHNIRDSPERVKGPMFRTDGVVSALRHQNPNAIAPQGLGIDSKIHRLTPLECERLQGFPDGWTEFGQDGESISDTQRYKMLGNAVTVDVIEAIGRCFS